MAHKNNAVASTSSKPTRQRIRRTGKKPGKISWVHGTKEKFFTSRSDEWLSAQRMGTAKLGKFYDDITNLYIQKYGYDLKDDEDLEEDEEATRRSQISSTVRGRIGQWYRAHYGGGVEQGKKNIFKDLLSVGANIGAAPPARMQTWQYYSKLHYDERVKARFDIVWKAEVQRAKDLKLPEPHVVKVRGEVTRQAWEEETEDFKATVTAAQKKEYDQILRAWELGRAEESSHTPEELHATLKNAALYLQPLADTIQERFSMNVAIMLCGPIGELGGAIQYTLGDYGGPEPKKWYNFDPVGYQAAEASMVRFSEKTFSGAGENATWRLQAAQARVSLHRPGMNAAGGSGSRESHPPTPCATSRARKERRTPADNGTSAPPPPPRDDRAPTPGRDGTPAPPPRNDRPPTPVGDGMPAPPRESPEPVHEAWRRKDMAKWPEELRRAHSAFAMGAKWPEDWARLVNEYMDFEAAAGYPEDGPRIGVEGRPSEVGGVP
ncbi:hypothetical protein C8F04DRAFT_1282008 [Mycena alexandri]|uniref:Uncharacterized protein n=1 Tax=Mycena alexandri TaxID=1745969 RepID=A0AAD6RZU8_9AGAR|nr:hypothetical protein C8F04DRAFT_1282008 [Mycena alexandri]